MTVPSRPSDVRHAGRVLRRLILPKRWSASTPACSYENLLRRFSRNSAPKSLRLFGRRSAFGPGFDLASRLGQLGFALLSSQHLSGNFPFSPERKSSSSVAACWPSVFADVSIV